MFELIESCPERRGTMGWTGRVVSALIHVFLLSAAIAATRGVVEAVEPFIIQPRDVPWDVPRPQPVHGGGSTGSRSPISIPVNVPTDIPPPGDVPLDVPPAWDPQSIGCVTCIDPGPNLSLDPGTQVIPAGSVLDSRVVDEQPQLLWHPAPQYPAVLRQAGIEGRVMVEAVLDTLGRAEPGLARVVMSPHPMFDTEALTVVTASRYRPARVGGRAVRVRIRVPISFEIRR